MIQGRSFDLRRLATALTISATMMLTGCGEFFTPVNNNPGPGGTSTFAYVTNAGGTLTEYSLTNGVLAQLNGSPISLTLAPTELVVAPNNAFLYVGTSTGVFLYTINSDGTLTEGNDNTVIFLNQAGLSVSSMVVDPTSSWLIMAYTNSTEIDALQIDPTTGLAVGSAPFTVSSTFNTVSPRLAIAAANNNVAVALGSGGTQVFGFTPTATSKTPWGTSVSIPLKTANTSDTAVAIDPTSAYLYVTEADLNTTPKAGNVRLIKISDLSTDLGDYPTGIGPSAVFADPTGAYVYVTNSADATISAYTFTAASQSLSPLGTPTPSAKAVFTIAEDSSKTHIFAVGNGGNPNLWVYSFDATTPGLLNVSSTTSTSTSSTSLATGLALTH